MAGTGSDPFDIRSTFVHLSVDATATPLPDFAWTPEFLADYTARFAADECRGRLVMMMEMAATWDTWERHPAGDELVISCNATFDLHQEIDGEVRIVRLEPAGAIVNPAGVWHTADLVDPGYVVFVTPGEGTEHRPR
jgi:hypothetical protein